MKNFISDADFEKNIGFAPPKAQGANFISDADFEKNIGVGKPKAEKKSSLTPEQQEAIGRAKALGRGALEGISDLGRGVEQLYLKGGEAIGLLPKGTQEKHRAGVNKAKEEYKNIDYINEHPIASTIGEVAGGVAAILPAGGLAIPLKAAQAAKATTTLGRALQAGTSNTARTIGTGVAQGAGIGALQYDPTGEERLQNTLGGAAAGGALSGILAGGGRLIRGKSTPEAIAKRKELGELSKEHGVDLTVPELRDSKGGKYIESIAEKTPGSGYIGFREKQVKQFEDRANQLAQEMGGKSTQDTGQTVLNSLESRLNASKKIAGKKFDKVEQIAEQQGGKVEFNALKNEAKTIINDLEQLPPNFKNEELIGSVNNFLNLDNQSFSVARKLRSHLGDEVKRLKKEANSGAISAENYRYMTRLVQSLENDIDQFAGKSGGALKQAYKEANTFYKDKVVPFKSDELEKAIFGNYDKDQVIGAFLKPGREELASTLVNNVGKKGLQASRAAVLNNAIEKATHGELFNPQIFAKEALRLGKANNVLFSDAQRKSLEGYSKLAKVAERASKFAANPDTGHRTAGTLLAMGAGGGLIAAPVTTLAMMGGTMAGARLMQSELGRKLLTRAYNMPEKNTKGWNKLLQDAAKLIPPVAATKPDNNSLPQQ